MNLKSIPKVELHRHLEGSIRLSTLTELYHTVHKTKLSLLDAERKFQVKTPMKNLKEVIDKFMATQALLSSYEIIERITFEACEDAFNEGIYLLELRYAPSFINIGRDLNFDKIHEAVIAGAKRAESQFKMAVGFIGIMVRSQPVKEAERACDFFIDHKDTFCGVDLADQELGFDCKTFSNVFLKAKKAGLRITCHSGEEDVAEAPQFVRDSIDYCYAERIGHGLQIYKDPKTIEYVKQKGIYLELCPTSNVLTNSCKDIASHPFAFLTKEGVLTTLNSDDPGVFGIDLTHEWHALLNTNSINLNDLKLATHRAFTASFLPEVKKATVKQHYL
ncbi:MAG: adenosine deaminase [Bdellovibrionales bacterium]|nr:adenosine deaminase [Bdellovibrionales bacterium]